jgi:hypothetical protein
VSRGGFEVRCRLVQARHGGGILNIGIHAEYPLDTCEC